MKHRVWSMFDELFINTQIKQLIRRRYLVRDISVVHSTGVPGMLYYPSTLPLPVHVYLPPYIAYVSLTTVVIQGNSVKTFTRVS